MAYSPGPWDRDHGYLQFGGKLPGNETWSCGFRMSATEGTVIGGENTGGWDMDELVDHYVTAITAWFSNANAHIHPSCKLQFVKFNKINQSGHYIEPTTTERVFTDVPGGGGQIGSVLYPNQVALAITLTTAVNRGPAHAGRIYSPMPCMAVGADGLITIAAADYVRTGFRTLLEAISDAPGLDTVEGAPDVVVMSRKQGAPITRRVTGIRVGRVLDTQRRRRRSLPESYEVDAVDFGAA